jgi:hypothetical protein
MPRTYTVAGANLTLSNQAVSLVFVNVGTTTSLEFLRMWASQSSSNNTAQQRVQINTQVSAFPTLTSQTPGKNWLLDPASQITGGSAGAAGTSGVNASAEGAGAKTILYPDAFSIVNGWLWVPTPAETYTLNAGAASGMGLHFPAAPGSLGNWNAGQVFRETA